MDNALTMLREDGLMGVTDFYVSGKFDKRPRQMSWLRRFFWRSIFDTDNIDIGPERRHYLDHKLKGRCRGLPLPSAARVCVYCLWF